MISVDYIMNALEHSFDYLFFIHPVHGSEVSSASFENKNPYDFDCENELNFAYFLQKKDFKKECIS